MLGDKERFSEILLDEKNEIEEIKKIIKDKSSLASDIKRIRYELGVIELALKPMEKELNRKVNRIEDLDNKIRQLNFEVQSRDIDKMAFTITRNLPDGFGGLKNSEEYDENNLKSINLCYTSTNKINFKKDKEMPEIIGKINISGTKDKQFEVDVTLRDKMDSNFKEAKFIIPDLYRIYKIIAWINTNLHYILRERL